MGVISQALSGLAALTNKFYQFGDSTTAPMHVLSDLSGNAIDLSLPAEMVGNVAHDGVDSGKPVKIGGKASGTSGSTGPTAVSDGDRVDAWLTPQGAMVIAAASYGGNTGSDGVNVLMGLARRDATSAVPQPLAVHNFLYNGTTFDRSVKANSASRIASAAASVNATSAKGSAGNVFRIAGNNVKASVIYLKIYNKATAPTVGTDTPVLTIPIPASAPFNIDIGGANGFYLGTGIAYGFTTDAADNGTTALSAGDILGFTLTYA